MDAPHGQRKANMDRQDRILATSARFTRRSIKGIPFRVRRVVVLRAFYVKVRLSIRVRRTILSLRHLSKRSRAALRVVLPAVREAPYRTSMGLQVPISCLPSRDVRAAMRITLLLEDRTFRIERSTVNLRVLLRASTMNRPVGIRILRLEARHRHITQEVIRRRSIVRLRSSTLRALVIPLQPFCVQFTSRSQRHVLRRKRARKNLQLTQSMARLARGGMITRRR